jgi:Fe-S-cluster-containing dehydrogenase component
MLQEKPITPAWLKFASGRLKAMARYGMVVDLKKCTGCYNCFLTCRDEYAGNNYPGYSAPQTMAGMNWMKVIEKERGQYPKVKVAYIPVTCMHCENANCIKAAQNKAVYRRPDGIVIIDPVKAKGQKQIVEACPYRVIEWNEEQQVAQKCTMCAHLLDKGEKVPRCVESCPSGAISFGDLDDPKSDVARLAAEGKTEALYPEFGMVEKVKYLNLPKKFVAGTVIYGDIDECAVGVSVSLSGNGETRLTKTDDFGDFEFEGLADNTDYSVKIEASGYKSKSLKTRTQKDTFLGEIVLKK